MDHKSKEFEGLVKNNLHRSQQFKGFCGVYIIKT